MQCLQRRCACSTKVFQLCRGWVTPGPTGTWQSSKQHRYWSWTHAAVGPQALLHSLPSQLRATTPGMSHLGAHEHTCVLQCSGWGGSSRLCPLHLFSLAAHDAALVCVCVCAPQQLPLCRLGQGHMNLLAPSCMWVLSSPPPDGWEVWELDEPHSNG
jgi:hypothetical protein